MKQLICVILCLNCALISEVLGNEKSIIQKGDVMLGAIFPLHQECDGASRVDLGGLELTEAMLMAIDEINANQTFFKNKTLGAIIEDSCSSSKLAMTKSLEFTKVYNQPGGEFDKSAIKGLVVIDSPNIVSPVTEILSKFDIVQIATSENPFDENDQYPTVANIDIPAANPAIVLGNVAQQLNITEISAIVSKTQDDINALDAFKNSSGGTIMIKSNQVIPIDAKEREFETLLERAVASNTSHILLLTESEQEAREILEATIRLHYEDRKINASKITWLASNGWGSSLEIVSGKEKAVLGAITIERSFPDKPLSLDSKHKCRDTENDQTSECCWDYKNNKNQSCWHRHYLKNRSTSCRTNGGAEQPPKFQNPRFHYVFESVYAYAHALDKCFQENSGSCNISNEQFVAYLRAEINENSNEDYKVLKFRINQDGEFGYQDLLVNGSKCSMDIEQENQCEIDTNVAKDNGACPENQIWPSRSSYETNCPRKCKSCSRYSEKIDDEHCQRISLNKDKNDKDRATMYPLDHKLGNDWTPLIYFLWTLTFIGLAYLLFIAIVFFVYRKTPVVRLSHGWRPLMLGMAILLLDTFVELEKPSTLVCTFRRFILGIGLTTTYGVLFVRGFSKYRILHELLEERKSHIAQVKMQRLIFALLITVQLLISVVWCMIKSPGVTTDFEPNSDEPGMMRCNTDEIARFFTQAYNFILITVTTFFAIRTRNIPCAFSEAKWMFYAMLSNWVVGLAFAVAHYTNLDNYATARVSLSLTTIISTYLVMLFMSLPKIYIILIKPERNVMCDDLEELENSVYDEYDANRAKKNVPKIEVEKIGSEPDLIQKAESKDNIQTEKLQSETKQPEEKLLNEEDSKDVIVHSPE